MKGLKQSLGQIPGAPVYIGSKDTTKIEVDVLNYAANFIEQIDIKDIGGLMDYYFTDSVTWVNVNGLNDIKTIQEIGNVTNLHPLIIEDIVNTHQRPKIEEYDNYLFVVMKMLYFDDQEKLCTEHLSLVLSSKAVISFQEIEGDVFEPIRDRIRNAKGRIRSMGADYLFYALMDAVVDNYFIMLEALGDKVSLIEDSLFENKEEKNYISDIQSLKKEILKIRKAVLPIRELVNKLEKGENEVITSKTKYYLRDLYDHTIQVSENVEIYREMIWGLMDMYMTTLSNKMNEVMKVLTIIATIFIPLTFLVGVYGMNFKNMPELEIPYAYGVFWIVILIVFISLILFFKRKKWL